jgi:NTP pyrophosphatase (non-canonical NTP hydrolase)
MKTLNQLQDEQAEWDARNFGPIDDQPVSHGMYGIMEELGELAHAQLKGEQKIRHTPVEIYNLKVDAIGDLLVFLMKYCNHEHISLQFALEKTWDKVKQRDWSANPMADHQ